MTIAGMLLRAPHIGIRELKTNLSRLLKKGDPLIVTERGIPVEVMLPYSDIVEIAELIDEATDLKTLRAVQEGRLAVKRGSRGLSASNLFNKIRKKHK